MNNAQAKIEQYLQGLPEWQQQSLQVFRGLVHQVEPDVTEDWKWNVPVFLSRGKLVCAMSGFKTHTKFNFFHGAKLTDPDKYLNAGLESKAMRSLDLREKDEVDQAKLTALLKEAFVISQS